MIYYFAHGSNMWQPRLEARVGAVRVHGIARLADHALRWHKRSTDGSGKCDVVASIADCVWGVLYEVQAPQLQDLDAVEGVGNGYLRDSSLSVACDGQTIPVSMYRAQASHVAADLLPYDWYHGLVLAGARAHGLPADYVETIVRQWTRSDPEPARGARERAAAPPPPPT